MSRFTLNPCFFTVCVFVAVALFLARSARATPTFTSLYSFATANTNDDGGNPTSPVIQGSDGNFYGTTYQGGSSGYGTAFKITPGGVLTTLVNFDVANGGPNALIQGSDGNFYGTTQDTVIKMTPTGTLTTLAIFDNFTTGLTPNNLIEGSDGNFYGTTQAGGSGYAGTLFKVTPTGALTILVNFTFTNGGMPMAGLVQGSDGNFYGTTRFGNPGLGTVFQVTPTGTLTTLHNFSATDSNGDNSDGDSPLAGLIQGRDGSFYGVSSQGGSAGYGTAFKVTSTGVFTTLANFTGANGSSANSLVQGSDGNFYGTTQAGGLFGEGTAFKLSPSGALTTLFNFEGTTHGSRPDAALVQGRDGNFYGTARTDGSSGTGVVFKMSSTGTITPLHVFSDFNADGGYPSFAPLVRGSDGDYYGIEGGGGAFGYGALFKTTSSGTITVLHSFSDDLEEGGNPEGLVQGRDGNFYGTTQYGGTYGTVEQSGSGDGTVFKISPTGALTTLHIFTGADGNDPMNGLIQATDGNFYGTTQEGGTSEGTGTTFKITPTGTLTTLVNFTFAVVNGANALVQGKDGNFYGTSSGGSSTDYGTIFKVTPAGVLTVLYNFSNDNSGTNSDGARPMAGLIQATDGNFYGTAYQGGTYGNGTVFKVTPAGTFTTLYSFIDQSGAASTDGASPTTALIQATDGNFYGTTFSGGSGGNGTIFSITSSGTLTTLHNFSGSDGSSPNALVQGTDGNFYGTTRFGESTDDGTIFQLTGPVPPPTWTAKDVAAASDGTARMLWIRSDGAAGIWIMNAADNQTAYGQTYGPYADTHGTWTAKAVSVAGDGTARMLWTRSDGAAGIWSISAAGMETTIGPTYGPYTGWTAADVAADTDGTSHVLWTNTSGAAGVWTMNASDTQTIIGKTYGPYPGWTAKAVGGSGDGSSRVLWTNTNGAAGVWTLNASDVETIIGTTYGPYSDSHGMWSASDLGTSSDGASQVLWTRSDGAAGVWTLTDTNVQGTVGPTYGPYPGYAAGALDSAGGTSRVLWVNTDRAAGLWTFGANDAESVIGSVYGPY